MTVLKRLININRSKAVVIPYEYFEYYRRKGKEIHEVCLQLGKKIVIEPILEDCKQRKK